MATEKAWFWGERTFCFGGKVYTICLKGIYYLPEGYMPFAQKITTFVCNLINTSPLSPSSFLEVMCTRENLIHVMASKPLQFTVVERKLSVGKHAGKVMQVAIPTRRHRIDFRSFCERVAKSTTFNRQEVEAVLNYATEIAKDIVADGDIVDFGDLGSLMPSFKSKAVELGQKFNANIHIEKPVVLLQPSKKYFTLTDVTYEQTEAVTKAAKSKPKKNMPEGGTPSEGNGHVGI